MARQQYVVVKGGRDEWSVTHHGKSDGPYKTQREAIGIAVDKAHKDGEKGNDAQVVVQGEDRLFRTEWTYGHDPYPPAG
jgi:hypothetical protein